MGINMILHVTPNYILINIDFKSAYIAIWMAAVIEQHQAHMTPRRIVPYRSAKLGPRSLI
jgi:hypothetical protein